jgi:putative nucleotide binding protein
VHRQRPHSGRRTPRQQRGERFDIASFERVGVVLDFLPFGNRRDPHRHHQREPVVQALGVRGFTLLDGIPLNFNDIDFLEKVTLLSEVYKTLIYPDTRRGVGRLSLFLACLKERESTACFPSNPLSDEEMELLLDSFETRQKIVVFNDFDKFEELVTSKGLPRPMIRVPPTPIHYEDLTPTARDNLEKAVSLIVKERESEFVEFFNIAEPINVRLHAIELLPGIGKKTLKKILQYRLQKPFSSFEEVHKVAKIDPVTALTEKILEEIRGESTYYLFVKPPSRDKPFLGYLQRLSARAHR